MTMSFEGSIACAADVVAVGGVAASCCIATEKACAAGVMLAEGMSWALVSEGFEDDMIGEVECLPVVVDFLLSCDVFELL